MMFSARVTEYQSNAMLNICDEALLGTDVTEGELSMHISRGYYGGRTVDRRGAEELLRGASIINMAGRETVSLAIDLGIGSEKGVRRVSDVPFLIVFKM